MNIRRLNPYFLALNAGLGLVGAATGFYIVHFVLDPQIPDPAEIHELKLQVPLRIYSEDGKLIGEFGAERRAPLNFDQIPKRVIQAFLAAEDDRFFQHPGVDWHGLLRAAIHYALTGRKTQGGSTITMQVARNYFLSSRRTFTRKAKEILLALRMEKELTKQQILEAYLNKIYLGNRAYGIGAAAQTYFGKEPKDLSLSETAVLAGLPKAPSRDNPIDSPARAKVRRDYVLRRMRDLNFITAVQFRHAMAEPIDAKLRPTPVDVDASYVAEMVRQDMYQRYGDAIYTGGYVVTTTIDSQMQQAADDGLRQALQAYDRRHGYRGPEAQLPPQVLDSATNPALARERMLAAIDRRPDVAGLLPAAVLQSSPKRITVLTKDYGVILLEPQDFKWAKLDQKTLPKRGDIIRITRAGKRWKLAQIPNVEGALVALDPHDGAIKALIGGYDFFQGKYNRVVLAQRQVGSGFKPFYYAAALEAGYTPASVILDAPVVLSDPSLEGVWRPENYERDFRGPMRLREALVHSRNLVSIRLLQAIGVNYARDFAARFGLPEDRMPKNLSLALGTASFTPLEMARAYAVFANDGFLVDPYYIKEIRSAGGQVLYHADPAVACDSCGQPSAPPAKGIKTAGSAVASKQSPPSQPDQDQPQNEKLAPRVLDRRTVYLMTDMMHDVVTRGTGARAAELGRNDLAGKTGTTNDFTDAWFNGFDEHLVSVAWVGFDQPSSLGHGEAGARAALPAWMDFMRVALQHVPQDRYPRPPGVVTVRINPKTGKLAAANDPDAIFEIVQADHIPPPEALIRAKRGNGKSVTDIY